MSGLACVLWWLVLGGLLGLLGSWLIGRLFRSAMPAPQERIVEKFVDRPVDRPVEKIVEVEKLVETIVERPVEKIVEKIIETPVDRIVEKLVDNPSQAARIAALTAEVAVMAGLRDRIKQFESTPSRVVERIVDRPVEKIVERIVDRPVEKIIEKFIDRPVEKIVEKVVDRPVEKIVEKPVDNPAQATRIATLMAEVAVIAGLRNRIKQLEDTPPKVVEKIVEKVVDRPVEKIVEKIIEKVVDRPVDKIVEKIVDRPVDRIVEKLVDNPAQATRIAALTAEVAVISGLRSRIKQLEDTPPKVVEKIVDRPVEKIVDRPVEKIVEKIVDRPVEKIVEQIVDRPVDSPALLTQVASLRARISELEGHLQSARTEAAQAAMPAPLDLAAAKAAGFTVKGEDDLELIEGIGPKIAELFRAKDIRTFAQLAATPQSRMREILDEAGPNYRIANPGTWAEQADLAARNKWAALRALQDVLDAGVRLNSKALATELAELKKKLAAGGGGSAPVARAERPINIEAAKAAGFNIKGADDLEIIEGIGPKICQLLHAAGIKTFAQLADTTPGQIQPILDKAGADFRLADPQTWPEQSALAAMNHWQALKSLQETLNAGKR